MIIVRYLIVFFIYWFSAGICCQTSPFLILDWRNPDNHILQSGQLSFSTHPSSSPNFDLSIFESNTISIESYLDQINNAFKELPRKKQNIIIFINGYSCQRKSSIIANGELLNTNFIQQAGSNIGLFTSFNWNGGIAYGKAMPHAVEIGYFYADILLQIHALLESTNPEVKLFLITHSMGNRVFTGMYKRLVEKQQTGVFDHHIMSAPDIEPNIFNEGEELEHIDKISKSITIYSNSHDRMLRMVIGISKQDRLGLSSLAEKQLDEISLHISVVDCSETNDLKTFNLWRHNYCKKSERVTEDIYYTLTGQTEKTAINRVKTKHPRKFYLKFDK